MVESNQTTYHLECSDEYEYLTSLGDYVHNQMIFGCMFHVSRLEKAGVKACQARFQGLTKIFNLQRCSTVDLNKSLRI